MDDPLDELIRPGRTSRGVPGHGGGAPLDAAEDDPDAATVAGLPGYSAGGVGEGDVGPPSSDHQRPAQA